MARSLVVVESPAKARTLAKYLGGDYQIAATVGHVMDLPKNQLGVNIEDDFAPEYHVIHGKGKVIEAIRRAAKDKDQIYLAPDPDREGEAIAWHVAEKLGRCRAQVQRVLFNEITRAAVVEAIHNPRPLDRAKYESQMARRVLDRLVGYQISPLLWKKVRRGLSAGRVQSVAVRIICERERAIEQFVPVEYWSVSATLDGHVPPPFAARLVAVAGEKVDLEHRIADQAAAEAITARLAGAEWVVAGVERKERRRNALPPLVTARLQQEASRRLGFNPSRTMRIAQRLYEGLELGDEGAVGLITYMRTDSTRLSDEAVAAARGFIGREFGKAYVPAKPLIYRSKRKAQDAHEAIRPTDVERTPERVAPFLGKEEIALYRLIWNRFVACQMAPAVFDQTAVDIAAADCAFRATGQLLKFDGFLRLYGEEREENGKGDEDAGEGLLPPLTVGERLRLVRLEKAQHFTQPPPRFAQASLIRELEEKGIGRPSTYASIIATILDKGYVHEDEQRRLRPTELGLLVTDLLVEAFPDVLNVKFTAGMEDTLDRIEAGKESWVKATRRFYRRFARDLAKAERVMRDVKREVRPTDILCDRCGQSMVIRWGRKGEFLACSAYPECRNTKNFERDEDGRIRPARQEMTDIACERCGRLMQVRSGRYGKFLGCSGYPECKNVQPLRKPVAVGVRCPQCGEGEIVERRSRRGKVFFSCGRYPKCRFALWERPVPQPCPTCGAAFVVEKTTKRDGTVRRCLRESCQYRENLTEAVGT